MPRAVSSRNCREIYRSGQVIGVRELGEAHDLELFGGAAEQLLEDPVARDDRAIESDYRNPKAATPWSALPPAVEWGEVIRAARSFAAGDAAEATAVLLSMDGGGGEDRRTGSHPLHHGPSGDDRSDSLD